MADANRAAHDDLVRRLTENPHRFGFFQALRLLEASVDDAPGFGRSRRARQDPVRLGQIPYLSFASSTLSAMDPANEHRPERLYQNFHGLFGPNGPLPMHLTEFAMERQLSFHDPTFARFCDIFHHRLLSLFYRIWANAEPAVCEDRPETNRFRAYAGALVGVGTPALREGDAMPDLARLFHAGHYGNQSRSAEGLLGVVRQQFEMPVALEEFQAEWLDFPREARLYLGQSTNTGCLGVNAVIGERALERQFRFALTFGPLSLEEFEYLLPNKKAVDRLAAMVRSYVGLEYAWEYRMYLAEGETPPVRLGQYGELGWSTWLAGTRRGSEDPDFFYSPPFQTKMREASNG